MIFNPFRKTPPVEAAPPEEPLLIVPVPALVAVLVALEKEKGAPLTEDEVTAARDGCACIAMPAAVAAEMAASRGYDDLDPEDIWAEWQAFLASPEWRAHLAEE